MGLAQAVLVEIVRGTGALCHLAETLGRDKRGVVKAVQQVKRRGLVVIVAPGCYEPTAEGIAWVAEGKEIKAGQGARPRTATRGLRQRAWWVIRARKTVTIPELLSTLVESGEKGASSNLSSYVGPLVKAGFLKVLAHRAPGRALTSNGHRRYQLIRNNGRLAPVVRQTDRVVFDPNTGEVFPYGGQP